MRSIKASRVVLILFLVFISNGKSVAQSGPVKETPEKITSPGLTLSGGGAKGLAHIGVIHILDSLGISVRYISGTSMGSIIGGMYASGYSAKEIEAFATGIDWETLFAAKASLKYLPPQERSNSGKNIVELSIEKGKINLPTGAIEGQQLWNTLNEIFLRVYQVSDFEQLPIPFACVATDVENGTPVVMKTGNLSSAVRASMAIPSVFTAVIRDEKKLIDGGVVKNFPVSVVRDLGADFVIGVNVSQGLRRSEELRTPVDIIYQMGFYLDAQNFINDQKLTDIYIEPDLTGFTAASFSNAQEIIERGKIAARSKMKSLQLLAGKLQTSTPWHADSVSGRKNEFYITDTILISGNKRNSNHYIKSKLGISPGDTLYPEDFTAAVNRLYASTGFERINYFLSSSPKPGKVNLNIDVIEKPHAKILAGLNYSTFNGIGIIAGVQTNRFIFNNTHAFGKILIGKNPAFRTGITFYPGIKRYNWLNIEAYGMQLKFPVYDNFKPVYEYSQTRTQINLSANKVTGKNSFISIGTSIFFHELKPKIISEQTVKGSNSGFETFLKWNYHTLNRNSFPLSGQNISLQASLFHGQNPHFKATSYNGESISLNELKITIDDFLQTHMIWETFLPLSKRATQIIRFQTGYNFSYNQSFINSFNLGGTNNFLDKQLVFTGLNDYEIITNSALTGAFGLQYQIGNNVFLTGILNSGMYDFELEHLSRTTYSDNVIVGAGLSLGYLSLLGPIELTFSYSPQTEKIIGYINLGWSF